MYELKTQLIDQKQEYIKNHFTPLQSPFHYISYASFNKNFQVHAQKNFKQENLNIIDVHLKYRQFILEEMAPYKWLPVLGFTSYYLLRLKLKGLFLFVPFLYVNLFDYYFQPFFCWLHKDDKIINVRNEFVTKLSKLKNKIRRLKLWNALQRQIIRQSEMDSQKQLKQIVRYLRPLVPHKYIKFGCPTQYIYHSRVKDVEMSTILQTKIFQTYMNIKSVNMNTPKIIYDNLTYLTTKFKQYRSSSNPKQCFINLKKQLLFKDIKEWQIYNVSMNIQNRIRRFLQIAAYAKNGTIFFSGFTLDKIFYMYSHRELMQPAKYNIDGNIPDLTLYYSAILIPLILQKIVRR